ncbi:MAG: hypothetical protein HQK77_01140 [Desulfobacterales bacterium]|nr:hypothetical protein [Desulfobacterales bacterium]
MAFITGLGWLDSFCMGHGLIDDKYSLQSNSKTISELNFKSIIDIPHSRLGRMDMYSKMGFLAIALALKDAGLDQWKQKRDISIIASTMYGCLTTDLAYWDTVLVDNGLFASPNLFAYTLPTVFLGEAAVCFGLIGQQFIVNDSSPIGISGLQLTIDTIDDEDTECMLYGLCDLFPPLEFCQHGQDICGAFFMVLEKTVQDGRKTYGEIYRNTMGDIIFNEKIIPNILVLINSLSHKTE